MQKVSPIWIWINIYIYLNTFYFSEFIGPVIIKRKRTQTTKKNIANKNILNVFSFNDCMHEFFCYLKN